MRQRYENTLVLPDEDEHAIYAVVAGLQDLLVKADDTIGVIMWESLQVAIVVEPQYGALVRMRVDVEELIDE